MASASASPGVVVTYNLMLLLLPLHAALLCLISNFVSASSHNAFADRMLAPVVIGQMVTVCAGVNIGSH